MFSHILILILSTLTHISPSISTCTRNNANTYTGFHAYLRTIDDVYKMSQKEILYNVVKRSKTRAAALLSPTKVTINSTNPVASVQLLVRPSPAEYKMDLAIGTPPSPYSAIVDTGNDLIWTQCNPCIHCVDQPTPFFDPLSSKTFLPLTCSSTSCLALDYPLCNQNICAYMYNYSDGANTAGILASETFTFGPSYDNVTVPNIAYSCSNLNVGSPFNETGMVGLGRGPLSLVNQLGPKRFAYCLSFLLAPFDSAFLFGTMANFSSPRINGPVQSTPLITNTALLSLYYISLIGITVGTTRLQIPISTFALNPDGTGGTIIDLGTSLTYLQNDAYNLVLQSFQSQVKLPMVTGNNFGLDMCFPWPPPPDSNITSLPRLTFHFDGANITSHEGEYGVYDLDAGLICVGIGPSNSDGSIIGNLQQEHKLMLYDLENGILSFATADCEFFFSIEV